MKKLKDPNLLKEQVEFFNYILNQKPNEIEEDRREILSCALINYNISCEFSCPFYLACERFLQEYFSKKYA